MQPLKLRAKSSQYLSEFAINLFNFHSMPSIAIAGVVIALWVGDVGQGEEMVTKGRVIRENYLWKQ